MVPPRRLAEAGMRRAVAEPRGTCGMITKPLLVSDRLYTSVLWALVMGTWLLSVARGVASCVCRVLSHDNVFLLLRRFVCTRR